MNQQAVPISGAARQSAVKAPTMRYYEQIEFLISPPCSEGNCGHYSVSGLADCKITMGTFVNLQKRRRLQASPSATSA